MRDSAIELITMRPEVPLQEAGVRWALSEFVKHRDDGVIHRIEEAEQAAASKDEAVDRASSIAHRFALGPTARWPTGVPRFASRHDAVDAVERHTVVRALGIEAADVATDDYVRAAQTVMARVATEHGSDPGLAALQHAMVEQATVRGAPYLAERTRALWRSYDQSIVRCTPFEVLMLARDGRVLIEWVGRVFRAATWSVPADPTLRRLQQLRASSTPLALHVPLVGPEFDEVNAHECASRAQMLIEDCYPLFQKIAPLAPTVVALTPLLRDIEALIPRARSARQAMQRWSADEAARARSLSGHPHPGCDWCGRTPVAEGMAGAVADSSFLHPHNPENDGRRPVIACSAHHRDALYDHYEQRPFFDEEVQAAGIARAFHQHPTGLTAEQLAVVSGLSDEQVDHLSVWHNEAERRGFYRSHLACSRRAPSFVRRDFKINFIPGN
ncbi:hypothetical protein ACIBUY_04655 [Streptomyces sp. NPDC050085]|uniref:hypothetical protein n=1 Tax=Streptomyces sp. NPDC050085 TaxID=3365600 RepID=UPI0037A851D1